MSIISRGSKGEDGKKKKKPVQLDSLTFEKVHILSRGDSSLTSFNGLTLIKAIKKAGNVTGSVPVTK